MLVFIFNCLFLEESLPRLKGHIRVWHRLWRSRHNLPPDRDSPRSRSTIPTPFSPASPAAGAPYAQTIAEFARGVHGDPIGVGDRRQTSSLITRGGSRDEAAASAQSVGVRSHWTSGGESPGAGSDAKEVARSDSAAAATAREVWGTRVKGKVPGHSDSGLELLALTRYVPAEDDVSPDGASPPPHKQCHSMTEPRQEVQAEEGQVGFDDTFANPGDAGTGAGSACGASAEGASNRAGRHDQSGVDGATAGIGLSRQRASPMTALGSWVKTGMSGPKARMTRGLGGVPIGHAVQRVGLMMSTGLISNRGVVPMPREWDRRQRGSRR